MKFIKICASPIIFYALCSAAYADKVKIIIDKTPVTAISEMTVEVPLPIKAYNGYGSYIVEGKAIDSLPSKANCQFYAINKDLIKEGKIPAKKYRVRLSFSHSGESWDTNKFWNSLKAFFNGRDNAKPGLVSYKSIEGDLIITCRSQSAERHLTIGELRDILGNKAKLYSGKLSHLDVGKNRWFDNGKVERAAVQVNQDERRPKPQEEPSSTTPEELNSTKAVGW